jgi:hypothetical protein
MMVSNAGFAFVALPLVRGAIRAGLQLWYCRKRKRRQQLEEFSNRWRPG